VRAFRALLLVSVVLGSANWLLADTIPDPVIRFTIPGGKSLPLCIPAEGEDTCTTTFEGAIGRDGYATIEVQNVNTSSAIEMDWFFTTDNLDQAFFATSTQFAGVGLTRFFNDDSCEGLSCFAGQLGVDYFGIGPGVPGSASLDPIFCDLDICPTATGFTPFSTVTVVTTYADVTDPEGCCNGLEPNEHGSIALSSDIPEPGTFVLVIGAAGVLAVKRRLSRA